MSDFDLSGLHPRVQQDIIPLPEYLEACRNDPSLYATQPERMLKAIGEPRLIRPTDSDRLRRIHLNRTVREYPAFADFYGMEEVVEAIVGFFKHAAQGLEEKKQILYLLGPVGGGKSSLAERLKQLAEEEHIHVLCDAEGNMSPLYESPLGLFERDVDRRKVSDRFDIPLRYLDTFMSPWARSVVDKKLDNDASKFMVCRVKPSRLRELGVMKVEPGDENNQDTTSLIGKVNMRELEEYDQHDARAYSFSGGLNRTTQGLLEFVEMFKAPIKMLHPLLTATQDGSYVGTENVGAMPYQGQVIAHSNETEWQQFRSNKANEAMLDRIAVVQVPYCLRVTEEQQIYQKLLNASAIGKAPLAPETLAILSRFSVMTRLVEPENSSLYSKMRCYDGEDLHEIDPKSKPLREYRTDAGVGEGMNGVSTRFAYKTLSETFNADPEEVGADPVLLFRVLKNRIRKEQYPEDVADRYIGWIKEELEPRYRKDFGKVLKHAYFDSFDSAAQAVFERYVKYARSWVRNEVFIEGQEQIELEELDNWCSQLEKLVGIASPKDFRRDIVQYYLENRPEKHTFPRWNEYRKIREAIEEFLFGQIENFEAVISFDDPVSQEDADRRDKFQARMLKEGYTSNQLRRTITWYQAKGKSAK